MSGLSASMARHQQQHRQQHHNTTTTTRSSNHLHHYPPPIPAAAAAAVAAQAQTDVYRSQRSHDPQSQQQQGLYNHRQKISPNFQHRSSPIAIIHNPEDGADQAKLRFQHPMYDTSDDEFDDDDLFHSSEGISVESLTSKDYNHRSPAGGPQSLPTNLLRAPKLGSIPSQDYRLHHLTTLPPPLSLNEEEDAYEEEEDQQQGGISQSSARQQQRQTYLSSYGSLRESHLTGRFGGMAASTGNLGVADHQKVRFQQQKQRTMGPPSNLGSLIPPLVPTNLPTHIKTLSPDQSPKLQQQGQPQQPTLSIRDRMMQKQKERDSDQQDSSEKQQPTSSLSAMLENQQQEGGGSQPTTSPRTDSITASVPNKSRAPPLTAMLPPGLAQAVAVSYNSNLTLLQQQQSRQQEQDQGGQVPDSTEQMLSSSMTGLEILRNASRNAQPLARPTSLSILQGSSGSGLVVPPPPAHAPRYGNGATSNGGEQLFPPLARANSEPNPHWASDPTKNTFRSSVGDVIANGNNGNVHTSTSTPSLLQQQQEQTSYLPFNASALIPPRNAMSSLSAAMQATATTQQTAGQQQVLYPQDAWTPAPFATSSRSSTGNGYPSYHNGHAAGTGGVQEDDHNPDTEGAFDMDLE